MEIRIMPNDLKMEDLQEPAPTSEATQETVEQTATEQDPLKVELERVQKKEVRSEFEKAQFSLKKNAERLKELGGDPASVLGIEKQMSEITENDDDAPVTVGMLRKIQQESATKTALQLADDIQNETERELTKYHIGNSIKSTGNPSEDLNLARAIVNAAKNSKIIEEIARKGSPKTHSSSSGAPARHDAEQEELTRDELVLMKMANLTREEVLKARPKSN